MVQTWADVFTRSLQNIFYGVVDFLPNLLVAFIVVVVGFILGALIKKLIETVVKTLKIDNALRSAGFEEVTRRAGFSLNSGRFLGTLVEWFIVAVAFVTGFEILGLYQVNDFLGAAVLGYLPQVIVAVVIILAAAVIAEIVEGVVAGGARAAQVRSAAFAGRIARWAIWGFAILVALDQLQIASAFVQTLFTGIVLAVAVALGLAFGLGGQHAASSLIDGMKRDLGKKD